MKNRRFLFLTLGLIGVLSGLAQGMMLRHALPLLDDAVRRLAGGIGLIGMSDFLFHPAVKVPAAPKELFSIVLDHEPLRPEQARDAGADLYLAGHTHAGQF